MRQRLFIIIEMLFCCLMIGAQGIKVSSFRLLETDLTANTSGTMEHDQNGEVAALIKVATTQTGFTFDGDNLGIVKAVQKTAEIWVYVPRGTKKITIAHPKLGILRDYYLPIPVEAARTYEMVLVSGVADAAIRQKSTSQYVVFQLSPSNAIVEIEGEKLQTVDGMAMKRVEFGSYKYRVEAPEHFPEVGKITVDDPENKHVVTIALKPQFSEVTLQVGDDAEIWMNGERKGISSWTGKIAAGTYKLETRKKNYRSVSVTRDIIGSSEPQTIRLQAPMPIPKVVKVGNVEFSMIEVRGGTFWMGSDIERRPILTGNIEDLERKRPKHQVELSSYYIGETEVTQELWETVMNSNPSDSKGSNKPVESVKWEDCLEFVKRLNQMTGLNFRLPTEAEWEYAARGGNRSLDYKYSGSNNLDDVGIKGGNPNLVKTKQANELGIYDMSGNVYEWCQDWYGEFSNSSSTNPTGPTSGSRRVIRGGSWISSNKECEVLSRSSYGPDYKRSDVGFRLACSSF